MLYLLSNACWWLMAEVVGVIWHWILCVPRRAIESDDSFVLQSTQSTMVDVQGAVARE